MIADTLVAASAQGEQNLHNKKRQPAHDKARHDDAQRLGRFPLAFHVDFALLHAAQIQHIRSVHVGVRTTRSRYLTATFSPITLGRTLLSLEFNPRGRQFAIFRMLGIIGIRRSVGIVHLRGPSAFVDAIFTSELIGRANRSELNGLTEHIIDEIATFRLVLMVTMVSIGEFPLQNAQIETLTRVIRLLRLK